MAYTTPVAYSVSEIVTAAKLNAQVKDNFIYFKDSPTFDGGIMVGTATGAGAGQIKAKGYAGFESISAESAYTGGTFMQLKNTTTGGRDFWLGSTGDGSGAGVGKLAFYDSTAGLFRGAMDNAGNFGFGTTAPQGRAHIVGAGGGVVFLSHNVVAGSIETLAVAGTVTIMAIMWGMIRNNGGSSLSFIGLISANTFQLGTTLVVNCNTASDQVTITVTAGGAVTAQRTNGSNSHAVNIWMVYK